MIEKAIEYIPTIREYPLIPKKIINLENAWHDNQEILKDVITRFNLKQNLALDIGVLFGYSTCALSEYFVNVIGVDTYKSKYSFISENLINEL